MDGRLIRSNHVRNAGFKRSLGIDALLIRSCLVACMPGMQDSRLTHFALSELHALGVLIRSCSAA
jgi:hypothetical protein